MTKVIKLDHYGRGIVKQDKITFIANTLVDEDIEYEIIKETKKYNVGKVKKINQENSKRIKPLCPYFNECGGCDLQHMSYEDTLIFKQNKVQEILKKFAKLQPGIEVIKNDQPYFYRNKISLKVKNKQIGFYEKESHNIIEIDKCYVAQKCLNNIISDLKLLQIKNGEITLRCNYNDELLISIKTKDEINNCFQELSNKHKIVGIVLNDKVIYGEDKFIDIINKKLFQVSYNSFFQINPYITSKMFDLIQENTKNTKNLLDLFCGVGTLGIAANNSGKTYAIECVENAIKNALINKKINHKENINYMLGDANKLVSKIKDDIDIIIVDPPRKGLDKEGLATILDIKVNKIIYISCDPMTLARDLTELTKIYNISKFYILDMFSYSYHVESFCVLDLK